MTKTDMKPKKRDAEATKKRILDAAKKEFARNGLGGARVDVIAERSKSNKRMIYHYFESKDLLFQQVLKAAYVDIRDAEQKLELDLLPPMEALEKLVRFTWHYYLKNPEFITLVNSANLHRARHLQKSERIRMISRRFMGMMNDLLDRGVREGVFRRGVDATQLNITIAAISYYYLTNRYTGSIIFEQDFMAPEALEKRLAFNIETIRRLVAR